MTRHVDHGRLTAHEGQPLAVSPELGGELSTAVANLEGELRPRMPQLSYDGRTARLQNLVGSFRVPSGLIVEVAPKTGPKDSWAASVVQLLEPDTRLSVTGSQRSSTSARQDSLSLAIALEYARRLEAALRRDGPLDVYERHQMSSRRLRGKLDVTSWVKSAVVDPTVFPLSRDDMTVSNDFTKGMSLVAGWLARALPGGQIASRLRRLQTAVIPGHAVPTYVDPAVALRHLPNQWRRYKPAWDIAAPLLRNRSAIGDPGRAAGLEVAVEPWPLLETLLTRSLRAIEREHDEYAFARKRNHSLLVQGSKHRLGVEPDGMLLFGGSVAATFECKYTVPGPTPSETHAHQALATAAALGSPVSVLVYPGDEPVTAYDVVGFHGTPVRLMTVGLSLFSYARGSGDSKRGDLLLKCLHSAVRQSGA